LNRTLKVAAPSLMNARGSGAEGACTPSLTNAVTKILAMLPHQLYNVFLSSLIAFQNCKKLTFAEILVTNLGKSLILTAAVVRTPVYDVSIDFESEHYCRYPCAIWRLHKFCYLVENARAVRMRGSVSKNRRNSSSRNDDCDGEQKSKW
jgi:hypothetical protein